MSKVAITPAQHDLSSLGIRAEQVYWNLSPETLARISVDSKTAMPTQSGAISVNTGKFTGRSPKDRFIVLDDITRDSVWWGDINIAFDADAFDRLQEKMGKYLSDKEIYVRDVYACADTRYRMPLRAVNEYPWGNLFVYNMFIRPEEEELKNFQPEWTIINAPGFLADPEVDGTRQANFAILNFSKKVILIGGTAYTGEIKKGIFSALNFILPEQKNTLSMHCSANVGKDNDTAIFFGLSGTGKTTLSADPNRKLIGDDEHGWTADDVIFNFEGGCYAKVIDLSAEKEPDIFNAIRPGALLENVIIDGTGKVDYTNKSITENTRVSYPIHHIRNIQKPSVGHNPKNIFFLTADAYGVLPPISKLTPGQAAYHFISGYTAKVAGTEAGITEPVAAFSACFGAPFMPLHPTRYAEMLSNKMQSSGVNVWLVNTGWSGGSYGIGERISLRHTRAIISAALNGQLENVNYIKHPVFGLNMPVECAGVPAEILDPKRTWDDPAAYDEASIELAGKFERNFAKYADGANEEILSGGPLVTARV